MKAELCDFAWSKVQVLVLGLTLAPRSLRASEEQEMDNSKWSWKSQGDYRML